MEKIDYIKEIRYFLDKTEVKRIYVSHLTEVAEPEFDEDGDEWPVVANVVAIWPDGRLVCYDECDEYDNEGNVDEEDLFDVSQLSEDVQKELLWAILNMRWPDDKH